MPELPSWLQVIIGVAGLILPFVVKSHSDRRRRRTETETHVNAWGIEYRRRDVTDDSQL